MTNPSNGAEALRRHRAQVSAAKKLRVAEVVEAVVAEGQQLSVSEVARRAEVSREFIYNHPELLQAIDQGRARISDQVPEVDTAPGRERALRNERDTLLKKVARDRRHIETLHDRVTDLEKQRARWLGAQLDAIANPLAMTELRVENDRLNARVNELQREVDVLRPILAGLEEDLRVSRAAHAETLRESLATHDNVTAIRPSSRVNDSE